MINKVSRYSPKVCHLESFETTPAMQKAWMERVKKPGNYFCRAVSVITFIGRAFYVSQAKAGGIYD